MNEIEMIEWLANEENEYTVTCDRWPNGHWRVGLDWWGENKYVFICEQPTLKEALAMAVDYVNNPKKY
jgi:hypothetical protein